MPGLRCENPLEFGRPLADAMPVEEWLVKLAERVGSYRKPVTKHAHAAKQEKVEPASLVIEPTGMELLDLEFDSMQSVISRAVANGKLDGVEAMLLGQQIERARAKRKGGMLAAIAGKSASGVNVPGYSTNAPTTLRRGKR